MLWSGGRACHASRGVGLRTQVHPAARPLHGTRLHCSRRPRITTAAVDTAGGTSSVEAEGRAALLPATLQLPVLSKPVQKLWNQLLRLFKNDSFPLRCEYTSQLSELQQLDQSQPHLLAWHMLARLRPYLRDGCPSNVEGWATEIIVQRAAHLTDYSPLVWALGLQQRVAPATSSALPTLPDPPISVGLKVYILMGTLDYVTSSSKGVGCSKHLVYMRQVLQQLQQQQPEVLEASAQRLLLWLWSLCDRADQQDAFWQILQDVPDLQQGAAEMTPWLEGQEVQAAADGFIQSGLLAEWACPDVWWLVARLDNSAGDRDRMLQVFGTLALQAPHHNAFDCLGAMLLQMASNARSRRKMSYPTGEYAGPDDDGKFLATELLVTASDVMPEVIPHLTCRLTAPEVVEWVTRLQLVWPPAQTHRLLLQLLSAPNSRKVFKVKGLLQLYDLLLQQLARPGWEPQQQAAMLPPAAGDAVLTALRDASKSRAAAVKVAAVWRHMAGVLDPAWCGGGLAAAAKAADKAVQQVHIAPCLQQHPQALGMCAVGSRSAAGRVRHQLLQQLSAKGQQQVVGALQQLGLQVELAEVGGAAAVQ